MNSSKKRLVLACKGEKTDRVPFWFMRQAGRYLPEYRELRARQKDFMAFCYSPDMASEATLQPIRRFGMDGAIIFSDILVVPHALGIEVRFEEGVGPRLSPVRDKKALAGLSDSGIEKKLSPVYDALRKVRKALPGETALIGFAGAPWTLACYVIEGASSDRFERVRETAQSDPEFFERLISLLTGAVIRHVNAQIEAGAEIIQIFDSWAGIANEELYPRFVLKPAAAIIKAVKAKYPDVPIIAFPRQSGVRFSDYASETGADVVSVDASVTLGWVRKFLQPHAIVQGALDPVLLAADGEAALTQAANILRVLDKPFVFNLGHGILPHTPPENMQALCEFLKNPS